VFWHSFPTAGFSHEGTTVHPEHKVALLRHQWFRSEPDKADWSTSHHSWEKTLIARTCLPPTTRPDVPAHNILQHLSTSCRADALPRLEESTWPAKEDWIQQVEEDHGCTIDSLWSSVQDRLLWRSLRPSLVRHSSEWVSEWVSFDSVSTVARRASGM